MENFLSTSVSQRVNISSRTRMKLCQRRNENGCVLANQTSSPVTCTTFPSMEHAKSASRRNNYRKLFKTSVCTSAHLESPKMCSLNSSREGHTINKRIRQNLFQIKLSRSFHFGRCIIYCSLVLISVCSQLIPSALCEASPALRNTNHEKAASPQFGNDNIGSSTSESLVSSSSSVSSSSHTHLGLAKRLSSTVGATSNEPGGLASSAASTTRPNLQLSISSRQLHKDGQQSL